MFSNKEYELQCTDRSNGPSIPCQLLHIKLGVTLQDHFQSTKKLHLFSFVCRTPTRETNSTKQKLKKKSKKKKLFKKKRKEKILCLILTLLQSFAIS